MKSRLITHALLPSAVLALLSYIVICAYLYEVQRREIFQPTALLQTTPDRLGMKYEVVHIPSGSGDDRGELYAWWIPAERPNAPAFLYLHGNDKNISQTHDVANAKRLHDMGYTLLVMDYRGYGKSTGGEPSEPKVYEDAEAGWNYLVKRAGTEPPSGPDSTGHGHAPSRLPMFIYGHSLGGAVAIELAIHHPEASGLIVESTFTSMKAMVRREYKYVPVNWLLTERFDSLHKVEKLKIPVLYIHGMMDQLIPYKMSEKLYEKSPQPKYLKLIEGGDHGNSAVMGWVEYRDTFDSFVKKYSH